MSRIATLTIPAGQTVSNAIGGRLFRFLRSITIKPPATLSGTVKIEVSDKLPESAVTADYADLQSAGADVNITGDNAVTISELSYGAMRLSTTVAPGSDEVYEVIAHDDPGAF
jgi:hypothetical protein